MTKQTVSNQSGLFNFPDLDFGCCEVTDSLEAFQTAAVNHGLQTGG